MFSISLSKRYTFSQNMVQASEWKLAYTRNERSLCSRKTNKGTINY